MSVNGIWRLIQFVQCEVRGRDDKELESIKRRNGAIGMGLCSPSTANLFRFVVTAHLSRSATAFSAQPAAQPFHSFPLAKAISDAASPVKFAFAQSRGLAVRSG